MAVYKNLKELGNNTLCHGDHVFFGELGYEVRSSHLSISSADLHNSQIFKVLFLYKHGFCTKHYGYEADTGDWPECKKGDYSALTRVVKALFEIIESKFKVGDEVYIIPYEECKEKGIDTMSIPSNCYGIPGIVQGETLAGNIRVKAADCIYNYGRGALKLIKDYDVKLTAPANLLKADLVQTGPISIADASQLEMYTKSNKIKVSSEFKFTVNKPKKVFF